MAAQIQISKSEPARAKIAGKRGAEAASLPFAGELALSLALDDAMLTWQRRGQLGPFVSVDEWAQVLAAAASAVKPEELVFPGLREARLAVFRGLPLVDYLRQHLGLDAPGADPARSQAGHAAPGTIASAELRVAAAGAGAGAHLPHAVGAAMAARALKRAEATLALAGVAAADSDDCHVALNFASVFRAPVVFLFRGDRDVPPGRLVRRASGYALPAEQMSGDDTTALQRRLIDLMAAARDGKGPALLEVGPPAKRQVDPSALAAARKRCETAFAEALSGRRPAPESLTQGVLSEPSWPLLAQARELAGETAVSPEEV